jgi:hypothetical protein
MRLIMHNRFCLSMLLLLLCWLPLMAQPQGDKQNFNETVDMFNFTTIQYVLQDDKNNPNAQQLAKRLPELQTNTNRLLEELRKAYNGGSRTEQLSQKIDSQKRKYQAELPLEPQLDSVITLILRDRQSKSYVASLKQDLQRTRDLQLQQKAIAAPYGAAGNQMLEELERRLTKLERNQDQKLSKIKSEIPMGFTITIILLSLLTIINLAIVYWLYKQQQSSPKGLNKDNEELLKSYLDFELFPRLKNDRKRFEKEIASIREELNQLRLQQAPGSGIDTDRKTIAEDIKEKIKDIAPAQPDRQRERERPREKASQPADRNRSRTNTPVTVRKYADYPREEGFTMQQLSDSSDRRSIYEIKMVPGNDFATFTLVDDPAIHEYAIQNRERLLKDACDFEITSSKHTKIEVQQPGKLQKKGNNIWQVHTKAKIKFV